MGVVIHKLYGIQPGLEARLKARGIKDSEDLLSACRSEADLLELARFAGVDPGLIRRLVHRADLARIRGIGETYTMLLEEAGVATVIDLAASSPEKLREQFTTINSQKRLVGRVPAQAMVNGWVNKAQRLPKRRE